VEEEIQQLPAFDTRHKGEVAQLRAQLAAAKKGFFCSRPTMEGCRYDLIVDDGRKLHRVQCKYVGIEKNGIVRVGLEKFTGGTKVYTSRTYSATEVDAIIVYVATIERLLWLPPDVWNGKHAVHLRLTPASNNQKKGILLIQDYLWG